MYRLVPEKYLHDLVGAYVQLKSEYRIPEEIRLILAGIRTLKMTILSMSCRLPVIASDITANLEVGQPTGCYHEVGEVKALAAKIEAFASQPQHRIDYNMGKYNWDVIADQVAGIYQSMQT